MKRSLSETLKKWMILGLIGCSFYLLGYWLGQKQKQSLLGHKKHRQESGITGKIESK